MSKLKVADYMKANKAMGRVAEMLENAFNGVGEKIRADLLKGYREYAEDRFKNFIEKIRTKSGPIKHDRYGRSEIRGWHEFAEYTDKSSRSWREWTTWDELRAVIGNFSLSYEKADKDANYAYENARDSFVYKNLGKLAEVMGKRDDLDHGVLRFDWKNGAFEGNVQIYLKDKSYFRGEVSIKYVIRTIPRVTPYFQYPLVFTEAEVGGKNYPRPSEEELRNLLSGKSSEQHEQEKKAAFIAAGFCSGGGKQVDSKVWSQIYMRMSKYAKCPDCGQTVSCPTGKFRQHKTAEFEKQAAAKKLTDAGYCEMSGNRAPYELISTMIRSHKVYPAGKEVTEYDFSLFGPDGKYRKLQCPSCRNIVPIKDARGALRPEDVRAIFQKHKVKK